jgi:hypothetical protein
VPDSPIPALSGTFDSQELIVAAELEQRQAAKLQEETVSASNPAGSEGMV